MSILKTKIRETIRNMSAGGGTASPLSRGSHLTVYSNQPSKSGPRRRKRWRTKHPLREIRLVRGLTLEELADQTDLSPSYLSRLESGSRRLNADIMNKLANALGCHPGDLLPLGGDSLSGQNFSTYSAANYASPSVSSNQNTQGHNLPVYTLSKEKNGEYLIDFPHPAEWMARSPELFESSKAYAISMPDQSMAPRYSEGDRLLVHPTKPLTPKCSVVVTTTASQVIIAQFIGWKAHESGTKAMAPIEANSQDVLVLSLIDESSDAGIYKSIEGVQVEGRNVLIQRGTISTMGRIIGSMETL